MYLINLIIYSTLIINSILILHHFIKNKYVICKSNNILYATLYLLLQIIKNLVER